MWEDPIVAEVHRIREELAARFDFDIHAICADIRTRQAALGSRLISPGELAKRAAADPVTEANSPADDPQSAPAA